MTLAGTILTTGPTGGLGQTLALELANRGAPEHRHAPRACPPGRARCRPGRSGLPAPAPVLPGVPSG
jgi:hypothetical protein